jgi:putative sterol carrier protein
MEVFTAAWCEACCARLNERESYRAAAAGWHGATVLSMAADPERGVATERSVWLDLEDGACRGARVAGASDVEGAAYVLRADPVTWERLLSGELEPVSAVMTGKLNLTRGNLFTLAKHAAAAREMVAAAGEVGGVFPTPRTGPEASA